MIFILDGSENEIDKETARGIQYNSDTKEVEDEQGEIFMVFYQPMKCAYLYLDYNICQHDIFLSF